MNDPVSSGLAALASLTQDIGGPVPVELLQAWVSGERSAARAAELLLPYRVLGTVASSDGSGLTRLTAERPVLGVLAMVEASKRIIHAVGVAVGGRAPGGRWIADNTQMIYPSTTPVAAVAAAALEVHGRIPRDGMGVGFAIHHGDFLEIGGGLYGDDADLVEYLAEECATCGETLLTRAALDAFGDRAGLEVEERADLLAHGVEAYRIVAMAPRPIAVEETAAAGSYPLPFSAEFHADLDRRADPSSELPSASIIDRSVLIVATQNRFVIANSVVGSEAMELLEELVQAARATLVVREALHAHRHGRVEVVRNSGGLAVFTFESAADALEVAFAIREALTPLGSPPRIGIDRGPVLLVPDGPNATSYGLAGHAVNVAAKLTDELGMPGCIRISDAAAAGLALGEAPSFVAQVSGVSLRGRVIGPASSA